MKRALSFLNHHIAFRCTDVRDQNAFHPHDGLIQRVQAEIGIAYPWASASAKSSVGRMMAEPLGWKPQIEFLVNYGRFGPNPHSGLVVHEFCCSLRSVVMEHTSTVGL
jgi:hypothetical protein